MSEILEKIAICIERGKINMASPFPPDMKGQEGADELTGKALESGIPPSDILTYGLMVGMQNIGIKFRENKVYVPDVLMSARAMNTSMKHLKPFFASGEVKRKGTLVIGTVSGDLHDIGKNLVAMIVEGNGWEVVDLGVDVSSQKLLAAVEQHPSCVVGLSALLTTTMMNMEKLVGEVKAKYPPVRCIVGGAPLTYDFARKIGADAYSPDPQGAVEYLDNLKNN
jgi:methanogenic corrinoid protein MtbC1